MLEKRVAVGACVVALGLSTLAAVNPAHADRKFTTQQVGGQVLRWNPCQAEVTYKANVKTMGGKKAQRKAVAEIRTAFKQLGEATGITFSYTGRTKAMPKGSSWFRKQGPTSEIVVAYAKRGGGRYATDLLPGSALGIGGTVYKTWGSGNAVIGRGYAIFDANRAKRLSSGFGSGLSRGNLILHELGHVMGLDHTSSKEQLMYPTLTSATPKGFARGDRAGLARIGARAGCVEVPNYVFSAS